MSKYVREKFEYPCGLKIEYEAKLGILTIISGNLPDRELLECPIHGKKCKKTKK